MFSQGCGGVQPLRLWGVRGAAAPCFMIWTMDYGPFSTDHGPFRPSVPWKNHQKRFLGKYIIQKTISGRKDHPKRFFGEDIIQKAVSRKRHHPKTSSWIGLHPTSVSIRHHRKNDFLKKRSSQKAIFGWRHHPKNDFMDIHGHDQTKYWEL